MNPDHKGKGLDAEREWRKPRRQDRAPMTPEERAKRNRSALKKLTEILETAAIEGTFTGPVTIHMRRGVAEKLEYTVATGAGLDWKLPTLGPPRNSSG